MTGDLVIFTFGIVVGAVLAGVAFGGAYAGFVWKMRGRRSL